MGFKNIDSQLCDRILDLVYMYRVVNVWDLATKLNLPIEHVYEHVMYLCYKRQLLLRNGVKACVPLKSPSKEEVVEKIAEIIYNDVNKVIGSCISFTSREIYSKLKDRYSKFPTISQISYFMSLLVENGDVELWNMNASKARRYIVHSTSQLWKMARGKTKEEAIDNLKNYILELDKKKVKKRRRRRRR